jgi:hypothetical protein
MRVLFDQATPVPIGPFLTGHTASTAAHEGWDKQRQDRDEEREAATDSKARLERFAEQMRKTVDQRR